MNDLPKYPSDDISQISNTPNDIRYVGFWDATKSGLIRTFDFQGRSTRSEFFWYLIGSLIWYWLLYYSVFLLLFIPSLILSASTEQLAAISGTIGLAWLVISLLAVRVRRMHDVGKSGHYLWLTFIPFANLYVLVLTFFDSQNESNAYGLPKTKTDSDQSQKNARSEEFRLKSLLNRKVAILYGVVLVAGSAFLAAYPNPPIFKEVDAPIVGTCWTVGSTVYQRDCSDWDADYIVTNTTINPNNCVDQYLVGESTDDWYYACLESN